MMSRLSLRTLDHSPATLPCRGEAALTRARARIAELEAELAELRGAEAAAHEAEALIRTIGESTPDLILVKDRASHLLYANAATLGVIGRPAEEVLGGSEADWHDNPAAVDRTVPGAATTVPDRRSTCSAQPL